MRNTIDETEGGRENKCIQHKKADFSTCQPKPTGIEIENDGAFMVEQIPVGEFTIQDTLPDNLEKSAVPALVYIERRNRPSEQ